MGLRALLSNPNPKTIYDLPSCSNWWLHQKADISLNGLNWRGSSSIPTPQPLWTIPAGFCKRKGSILSPGEGFHLLNGNLTGGDLPSSTNFKVFFLENPLGGGCHCQGPFFVESSLTEDPPVLPLHSSLCRLAKPLSICRTKTGKNEWMLALTITHPIISQDKSTLLSTLDKWALNKDIILSNGQVEWSYHVGTDSR